MNKLIANAFMQQFDIQKFTFQHKKYVPKIETVKLFKDNLFIGDYKFIRKITSSNSGVSWMFRERNNVYKRVILDKSFRQIPFMYDSIYLYSVFPDYPYTNLMYFAKPAGNNKIIIPEKPYSYKIAGIEYIQGFYLKKEQFDNSIFFVNQKIEKKDNTYIIHYKPDQNYKFFEVRAQLEGIVIDISQNGRIDKIFETRTIESTLPANSKKLTIPAKNIKNLPLFYNGKNNFQYIFADDILIEVAKINRDNDSVTIIFYESFPKDVKIRIPLVSNYELSENEYIEIELER